jgi:hypothetical protein
MFGRLFSLIGLSWGNGSISVDGPSEAPSFPAYGTFIETLTGMSVPITEGGSYVEYQGTQYESQRATVDSLADGFGGSFLDWANRRDSYFKNAEQFTTYTSYSAVIEINGENYGSGCTYTGDVLHDGSGWYYESGTVGGCTASGTFITNTGSGSNSISTPVGDFIYQSWDDLLYYHDGSGGYYSDSINLVQANHGDYIGGDGTSGSLQTEVPSGSGNYYTYATYDSTTYYFDVYNTSYYTSLENLNYYSYGTYIGNFDGYDYYWDGYGGYYY